MKTGPVVHGVLLAAALGVAWQTWTRDRAASPTLATLTVWPDAGPVESFAMKSRLRDVTVERRGEGPERYAWATVQKRTPPPKPRALPDAGTAASTSLAEPTGTTTTTAFPVSEDGEKALARLAGLKALRDLGTTASREEYGLGDESERLSVTSGGAAHELVLGAKVFGGDDRYVLDPAGGHVYVIAAEIMRPFDVPDFSLRERRLHGFLMSDVAQVKLRAGGKDRTLVRQPKPASPHDPAAADRPGGASWADAKTVDKPDAALTSFMDRVEQLAPTDFGQTPDAATLTPVLTVEYQANGGKALGTVELSKKPGAAAGTFDYFVKSERTRGLAKVSATAAGRVDQELAQIVP
jgi:Domain of unknown function (DUF4340)